MQMPETWHVTAGATEQPATAATNDITADHNLPRDHQTGQGSLARNTRFYRRLPVPLIIENVSLYVTLQLELEAISSEPHAKCLIETRPMSDRGYQPVVQRVGVFFGDW